MISVFLFAHPDDEFAVAGLITDRCLSGTQVLCLYLTDGGFGGQSVQRRNAESLQVLARLGVPAACVRFLGSELAIPDGTLHLHLELALQALRPLTLTATELFCPAWEGGHQDHDATHLLGLALAGGDVPILRQFSLYHGEGLPGPFFKVMAPLKANGPTEDRPSGWRERLTYTTLCWAYPTQWKTWVGLFPFVAWHLLSDGRFRLQTVDPRRVLDPPHRGRPLYERRGFLQHSQFRAHADAFIAKHIRWEVASSRVPAIES